MNSKNNGPFVLFKYIVRHWNCLLSPVETDDKDRRGLKLEKIGPPTFSSCNAVPAKPPKRFTLTYGKCSLTKPVWYLFLNSTKVLCAWVITLAQNWPKQQFPREKAPLGSLKALTNWSVLISSKRFKASRGSGWICNRLRRQLCQTLLAKVYGGACCRSKRGSAEMP